MVGTRLRLIRKQRGMSVSELAQRTGLTPSFVSQVENNKVNLSIMSLRHICNVLNVPMFELFLEEQEDDIVVRRGQRPTLQFAGTQVSYELLTPNTNCGIQVMELRLSQGEANAPQAMSHRGEEAALVTRGRVRVEVSQRTYELDPGDCIYFPSTVPHRYTNVGQGEAAIILSMTNPFVLSQLGYETGGLAQPPPPGPAGEEAALPEGMADAAGSEHAAGARAVTVKLRQSLDGDLKEWLDSVPPGDRSSAIRQALRYYVTQLRATRGTPRLGG